MATMDPSVCDPGEPGCYRAWDLGFRVQGLGFGVQGSGFEVSGFRAWGCCKGLYQGVLELYWVLPGVIRVSLRCVGVYRMLIRAFIRFAHLL